MANRRDGNRPKPVSLPVRMRSSTRAWPRWRSFQQLHRAAAERGVGDEHLVAQAFDGVEQAQLGAGVGPFPAHDHPGAVGVGGQVDQVGELGDLGAVAQVAGRRRSRGASPAQAVIAARIGSVIAAPTEKKVSHAVLAQAADVGQEGVAGAGRVAADQDVGAVAVGVGDLRQRLVEHGDVVGGGVRPGVARRAACPARASPVASRKHSSGW